MFLDHCEFCDYSPCDFIRDSSFAVDPCIVVKNIHTLLYNVTTSSVLK